MSTTKTADPGSQPPARHLVHESLDLVVTALIFVLLLKCFVAEFYGIPTGSMATTLLGNCRHGTCPECGYGFAVDASSELESPERPTLQVIGCQCQNCGAFLQGEDFQRFLGQQP